jgi:hypothetical protein
VGSDFLNELLDEYGRPRDRYFGRGEIANDQESAAVDWAAAQYDDGQVLLACQGDTSTFGIFLSGATRFDGTSSDGIKFDCRGDMGDLPFLRRIPDGQTGGWAVYRVNLLHADFPASGPPGLVRYLLTNFEFDRRKGRQRADLRLPGVEGNVRLVPDQTDTFAVDRLRALRSPRATAWLEIVPQGGQAVTTRPIANAICDLLSIARGTKVAWIQEELLSTAGERTHLNHSNRITKPFTALAPIDPARIGGTPEFLEMSYPVYRERRERYRLDHGTIDSVLDAKVQTDFLETRGAKLAVALESLKQNVLIQHDPAVEYHISPELFSTAVQELSEAMRDILLHRDVSKNAATAMASPERLLSLNRRSFSYLLRKTAKEIGLKVAPTDVELFVRCRNSLVHRGEFYTASATPAEREEVPPKATKVEEYFFLLSFVDAFLLRLVGYSGPYLARTLTPEGEERRL